jgi:hypothetical protein
MNSDTDELVGTSIGTRRFTCITPEIRPGADPAYNTEVGTPPIDAVTGD